MNKFEVKQQLEAIECWLAFARGKAKEARKSFNNGGYSDALTNIRSIHHCGQAITKLTKELQKELSRIGATNMENS